MAAYGKDDYYFGSDFSDFSDDDNFVDETFEAEDNGDVLRYCVCGLPATTEMIACDSDGCNIEWFHYECVGLTTDTIPEDSWHCDFCRPTEAAGTSSAKAKPKGSKSSLVKNDKPDLAKSSTTSSEKAKPKDGKKPPPKTVKRPPCIFSKQDAVERAPQYLKTAFEQARKHEVFQGTYPLAVCVMGLLTALSTVTDTTHFVEFSTATVSALWLAVTAGDNKFLKPEGMELVWKAFHKYKIQSNELWIEFLTSVNIDCNGKHVLILYQHVLQNVVRLLMKDRHSTDMPKNQKDTSHTAITKQEEQVLRYAAGYVPFALYKKFKKQANKTATIFCEILSTWRTCSTDTEKTFLEYTNEWIQRQTRGFLFHVNDDVYLFFRTMEQETRSFLSVDNLDKFPGINVKSGLKERIFSQMRLHNYWCTLTRGKITGDLSKRLLDCVVNLWIKIRIKSFIKVYLDLKKASGKASKKAEKAMRKSLPS